MPNFKYAVILAVLCCSHFAPAQQPTPTDYKSIFGLPSFAMQIDQFPDSDSTLTHIDVRLGMVNDILQFVRRSDGRFRAAYQVSLTLMRTDSAIIVERFAQNEVVVPRFPQTNSRDAYNQHAFDFRLPPGDYRLYLDVMDRETRLHLRRQQPVQVRTFAPDSLRLSSLVLAESHSGSDSLQPNLSGIFTRSDAPLSVRFSMSGIIPGDSLRVEYTLKDWSDTAVSAWQDTLMPATSTFELARMISEKLPYNGNFTLTINAHQQNRHAEGTTIFSLKFDPEALAAQSNGHADAQRHAALAYMLSKDEYRKLMALESVAREHQVQRFWESRDPTPGTARNELQEEFNRRVDFANAHFSIPSLQRQGWQTDRGRFYITYGPPTWVNAQANEFGIAALEVWYYQDIDKRFMFRDKNGNGEYKLIHQD